MNEEAQEILNRQFDKRIAKLENSIENMQKDLADIRCDVKTLIQHTNRSSERWEEYDRTMRKNKNDIIMKAILMVVSAVVTLMLTKLGLSQQNQGNIY